MQIQRQSMDKIDQYIHAATRQNTRRSYQSAIHHYEVEWRGYLPATAESVARYLADFAETLAINTLRHRPVSYTHLTLPTKA